MDREHQEQQRVSNDIYQYYFLNQIPENTLLIEREYFSTNPTKIERASDRTNNRNPTSSTEIIIALGFITTLLCFAGIQLHRSINIGSIKSDRQTEKTVTIDSIKDLNKIALKQFAWRIY